MKSLLLLIGRIGYFAGYPLLAFSLSRAERTRVVVRQDEQVLLVRSWLGNGGWDLPGGGLHKGENPLQGALREVQEEVGVQLLEKDLEHVKTLVFRSGLIRYRAHYFQVALPSKPRLKLQRMEILEAQWIKISSIQGIKLHPQLKQIIELQQP